MDPSLFTVGILALLLLEDEDAVSARNRRRRERWKALSWRERDERIRSIPRNSLHHPALSPWMKAYLSKEDRALITYTGLNFEAFERLHAPFAELFHAYTPFTEDGTIQRLDPNQKRGRRRIITSHACMGFVLMWTQTTSQYWALSPVFGIGGTSCGIWLRFGKRLLCSVLGERDDAVIRLPNAEKITLYIQAIATKHPALHNVIYVGDGLKIPLQKAGDDLTQEAFYNGWKSSHFITNVFVFAPDGTIVMAVINCPGTMHDSELASIGSPSIYSQLDLMYEKYGVKCVMDSAFATAGRESIIKSKKRETIATSANSNEEYEVMMQALSCRQSAEWGMRALQGAFRRLKATWPYEERDERFWGLSVIVHLYNYAANNMDLNQVRRVYWSEIYGEGNTTAVGTTEANETMEAI
jgi:hypothetical protein